MANGRCRCKGCEGYPLCACCVSRYLPAPDDDPESEMTSPDQPTGQERPARLTVEREQQIRGFIWPGYLAGAVPDLLAEIDALRSERDAWKARAERLRVALQTINRGAWASVSAAECYGMRDDTHLWQEIGEIARQALAEPQPPAEPFDLDALMDVVDDVMAEEGADEARVSPQPPAEPTADHPWFAWLPPGGSVHRNCCDRPQSEHPAGDIVSTLDQAGAALVEAGDAMVDDLDMLLFGGIELKPTDDGPVTFEAMLHLMQMMALHCDAWRQARGLDGKGETS